MLPKGGISEKHPARVLLDDAARGPDVNGGEALLSDKPRDFFVLMADDDADDCLLVRDAFRESGFPVRFFCVEDGEELMAYLRRRGRFSDAAQHPFPDLLLLDLNMPRMDGREALRSIKSDPRLRRLPIVVLSTSKEEHDVRAVYVSGASSFLTKPASFVELVRMITSLGNYWFRCVLLPSAPVEDGPE